MYKRPDDKCDLWLIRYKTKHSGTNKNYFRIKLKFRIKKVLKSLLCMVLFLVVCEHI